MINVFILNILLYDGVVIVCGDKIVCVGVYFILFSNENFEKIIGLRYCVVLGILEIMDLFIVVVLEEIGFIFLVINGVMIKMKDESILNEYLLLFMK